MSQIGDLKIKSHPNHPVNIVPLPVGEQESSCQKVKRPYSTATRKDGKAPVLVC